MCKCSTLMADELMEECAMDVQLQVLCRTVGGSAVVPPSEESSWGRPVPDRVEERIDPLIHNLQNSTVV